MSGFRVVHVLGSPLEPILKLADRVRVDIIQMKVAVRTVLGQVIRISFSYLPHLHHLTIFIVSLTISICFPSYIDSFMRYLFPLLRYPCYALHEVRLCLQCCDRLLALYTCACSCLALNLPLFHIDCYCMPRQHYTRPDGMDLRDSRTLHLAGRLQMSTAEP